MYFSMSFAKWCLQENLFSALVCASLCNTSIFCSTASFSCDTLPFCTHILTAFPCSFFLLVVGFSDYSFALFLVGNIYFGRWGFCLVIWPQSWPLSWRLCAKAKIDIDWQQLKAFVRVFACGANVGNGNCCLFLYRLYNHRWASVPRGHVT